MSICYGRSLRIAGVLTALSAVAAGGCSAALEADDTAGTEALSQDSVNQDSVNQDSVGQVAQSVIPGARVVQRISSSVSVAPGGAFTLSPGCSSGVLVGAGFNTSPKTRVYASVPTGNSWSVSNFNPDTVSHDLSAELYCLTGTNATTTVASSSSVTLRNNSVGCLTAACPKGSFAVSGGWNAGTPFHAYISQPDGTGWAICGKNTDFFNSTTFQSYALCIRGVQGSTRIAPQGSATIQRNSNGSIGGGSCATGQLLAGGTFNLANNGRQGIPFHTFRSSTRYNTEISNPYLSDPISVTASSVCLDLSP